MPIKENNFNNELRPSGTELFKKSNQKLGGWDFYFYLFSFFFGIYLYLKHSQGQDTKPKNGAFG